MKFRVSSPSHSGSSAGGRIAGRGCGTLFFGLFFAMGMLFVVLVLGEGLRQIAPWRWIEVPCTILSSAVEETGDDEKPYEPAVRYRFEIGGRSYEGHALSRGGVATASYDRARDRANRYPPGATATCRVDPENPVLSVLERGFPWIFVVVLFPLIFVAIGAGGLWVVWHGSSSPSEAESQPISRVAPKGQGRRFMIGLGLLFTTAGGVVFGFLFAAPALRTVASSDWEATQCMIVRSTVRSWSTDDGTSYRGDVLYEYAAHGQTWRSNRVTFFSALSSGRDEALTMRDRYPAGSAETAWVDPSNPSRSVLERRFRPKHLLGLLPLLFVIAGAALIGGGWRQQRAGTGPPPRTAEHGSDGRGPLVLSPQLSPMGKVFGTLFFAIFWNGIVSVFVWRAWTSWQSGRPDWFLTVFLIPFVLVGVAACGFVAYFALALANPRPRITVLGGEPCLGDELRIDWSFTGRASRLSRLRVVLEGREEATYRRGTDTVTDREVFSTITLVETANEWEIPRGSAAARIPDDTMHSLNSGSNRVMWEIKVSGDIRRWPDVDQNFPITVHPMRLEDV